MGNKKLKYKIAFIACMALMLITSPSLTQGQILKDFFQFKHPDQKSIRIKNKFSNNTIIIPLHINNSDSLFFILDSGLGTTLITELNVRDSFTINYAQEILLQGLGTGPSLKAIKSYGNQIRIGPVQNTSEEINVLMEDIFSLSKKNGMQINGIIGNTLFSRLIVEIDYIQHFVRFHKPETFRYRKSRRAVSFPLEIINRKPFFRTYVRLHTGERIPAKLLIDTGASISLWLAENSHPSITIPENNLYQFIGQGLNGNIYGYYSRIQSLEIGRYHLNKIITTYPDTLAISKILEKDQRNGSIGGEVLRRFRIIIDYPNKKVTFIPNKNLRDRFNYNTSGMEVETPYPGIPIFTIFFVNENSPAQKADIRAGDQIVSLNGLRSEELNLEKIMLLLKTEKKKRITLKIMRNGNILTKKFLLVNKI